jgi:integrase
MSKGCILKRSRKDGAPSWLLKYDAGHGPKTGTRRQRYKTVRGTERDDPFKPRGLLAQVDDGTDVAPSKVTIKERLRRWLSDYSPMKCGSLATLERYEAQVERHFAPIIGALPLQKLRAAYIQQIYADRLVNGQLGADSRRSNRTVHHIRFEGCQPVSNIIEDQGQ